MESLPRIKQKLSQFVAQQESVGIGLQTFKQKFVFNQNSGPDAIYLEINSPSPSSLLGMTIKQQNLCIFMMSQMIFKAGEMLKLPISTTIVALNISQYYFTRKSFFDFDFRDISMGAMFLACKSEQTLRRSYQIASVFDNLFKMYEGQRNIKELELNSLEYNYMKQKVTKTQNQILFELGFQVYKLFDIPHRYISGLISSFNKHKQCNLIVQHSWSFLNDIYRTKATVYYPGQVIASAAIFMALQKLDIPAPDRPWWILMEANIQQVKNIFAFANEMYEASNNNEININIVSQILQKIGKQLVKKSNVLPVPYYRKIRLQNQGLLMKPIEQPIQKIESQPEIQQENGKSQINHKEKSKKEKKQHKKKDKSRKNGDRSRSISSQKNKNQIKGKYQNDDQTPKIKHKFVETHLQSNGKERQFDENKTNNEENGHPQKESQTVRNNKEVPQRKNSEQNVTNLQKQQTSLKRSVLFDAKSMLSKISQQIKKIEVKNQMVISISKAQEATVNQNVQSIDDQVKKQLKENDNSQNSSQSEQQDELLAELIKIKKKNLQKKQEGN